MIKRSTVALLAAGSLALPAAPALAAQAHPVAHVWPATSYPGNVLVVSGTATAPEVSLQESIGHHWRTVAHASTTRGSYSFSVRAPRTVGNLDVRVLQASTASRTLTVRVLKALFSVTAAATSDTFTARPIAVTGTVSPTATGNVQLQCLVGDRWVTLASGPLSQTGSYAITTWQSPGQYGLRVVKAFTTTRGRGVSTPFNVVVRPATTTTTTTTTTTAPAITTTALPPGTNGSSYQTVLTATGGTPPYSWTAASLPAGLALSRDGHLTGTPTQPGTFTVVATLTDAAGRTSQVSFALDVAITPPTVASWGANDVGQLADGVPAFRATPVQPAGLSGIIGAASATRTGYALTSAGAVLAWGVGSSGQLGNGASVSSPTPVAVSGLGSGVTAVAGGGTTGYALKSNGTVWAWGTGSSGQLGSGNSGSTVPVQVPTLTGVTAIAAGSSDGYALKSDGTVWAWGVDFFGQLGDNSMFSPGHPVQVQGLTATVTAIAAGSNTAYALQNDGTVRAWGQNNTGQVGDASTTDRRTAVAVSGLSGVQAIAAQADGALALKNDGTVRGWGSGVSGALGSGATGTTSAPIVVNGLSGVTSIAGSSSAGYAVLADHTVRAWGLDADGDLGDGHTASSAAPVTVAAVSGITKVVGGQGETVLALTSGGALWQWGDEPAALFDRLVPGDVDSLSGATQLSADGSGAIALTSAGVAKDWGGNTLGSLGLGASGGPATSATTVPLPGTPVALGGTRRDPVTRYAVLADGSVLAWGTNQYGTLGTATPSSTATPTTVPVLTGIVAVAGGSASGYALASDGRVWSWGDDSRGELGDGAVNGGHPTPALVTGLTNVVAIAAGNGAGYALDSSGVVWSWGANDIGQLGRGNTSDSSVPVHVAALGTTTAIAAGDDAGYALQSDGTVKAWGAGSGGQLGNGGTGSVTTAVPVTGVTAATAIAASNGDGYAIVGGTVMAWGDNARGQLGNGTTTSSSTAAVVPGLTGVTAISASAMFALAVH